MGKFKEGAFGCGKVCKGGQSSRMKNIWENKVYMLIKMFFE